MRGLLKAVDDGKLPMFQELQDIHEVLLALKLDKIHLVDSA